MLYLVYKQSKMFTFYGKEDRPNRCLPYPAELKNCVFEGRG